MKNEFVGINFTVVVRTVQGKEQVVPKHIGEGTPQNEESRNRVFNGSHVPTSLIVDG